MHNRVYETVVFGRNGNLARIQNAGWSVPEEHWTWSDGESATLKLVAPVAPHGFFLELDWSPARRFPYISLQSVHIELKSRILDCISVARDGHYAVFCPALPDDKKSLTIRFQFPNAFRPSEFENNSKDSRLLALAFRRLRILVLDQPWSATPGNLSCDKITYSDVAGMQKQAEQLTGVQLQQMLRRFEMLAGNCDFGLAARAFQFENLSLLRFGGASAAYSIKGLENDFVGIGDKISLFIGPDPLKEWMVRDELGLIFHTGKSSLNTEQQTVERSFSGYADFLRRKLLEDLDEGKKIFIFADHKDVVTRSVAEVLPLYLSLRRRSRGALLWVCPALNDPEAKGSVRENFPGLAVGQLDVTAPPSLVGGGITLSGWLTVLCNAWKIFTSHDGMG
jgi:hypothetical protein